MISVIVPTMWKFEPFADFLWDVLQHPIVGQVVLIDNDVGSRPSHRIFDHSKITVLDFGRNIFVNPAWNVGAMYSICPILCFMNDDLLFDLRIFDRIKDLDEDWGMIGLFTNSERIVDRDIIISARDNEFPDLIGTLFFIQQKDWVDIPMVLNVYFGDNFLWEVIGKNKDNMFIKNFLYFTPKSQTSKVFLNYCLEKNTKHGAK